MIYNSILLELQYAAPVQYYTKLLTYETIFQEQMENYSKGSFRNRLYIATANGILCLSIPLVKGKHQQTDIRTVDIDYSQDWRQVHWRSIQTAYGSAPFFDYYADSIMQFYEKKYEKLFDLAIDFQKMMLNFLKLTPKIEFTSTFELSPKAGVLDFRNQISPKRYSKAELFDPSFEPRPYPQLFEDRYGFLPNLSILDLLFCTGPEALMYLRNSVKTG